MKRLALKDGDMMKLEKRDCRIEVKIFPRGAGWSDMSWYVPDKMREPLMLTTSDIGYNMSDFARALYYLYPNQNVPGHALDIIETVEYAFDMKTGQYGKMYRLGEDSPLGAYAVFPIKAEFHFDEEPGGSDWTLTREPPAKPNYDTDFPVHVHIALNKYKGGQFAREFDYADELDFDFMYSELCYAIGKALTDVIKTHGLYGYFFSTNDNIDLVQLVFLKAIALGCDDACKLTSLGKHNGESSDYKTEIELLLFDM